MIDPITKTNTATSPLGFTGDSRFTAPEWLNADREHARHANAARKARGTDRPSAHDADMAMKLLGVQVEAK